VAPSVDNYGLNTQTAAQPRAKANLFAAMRRRAGGRVAKMDSQIKYQMRKFYVVLQRQTGPGCDQHLA